VHFLSGVLEWCIRSVYSKKADFIVVENESALNDIKTLSDYILKNTRFRLPKLLISVTGGVINFSIDKETKNAFMRGLINAAKTTDSWIISGGTNVGLMRLVGDAIEEEFNGEFLPVIGVAWYQRLILENSRTQLYNGNNKDMGVNEILNVYFIIN
jgi:hypothetical protein